MRPIATDGVAWSVSWSVSLSRLNRSICRSGCGLGWAQGIIIIIIIIQKFITRTCSQALNMNRRRGKHALNGVQIPTCKEAISRAKRAGPGHAWTCPAVDILKATQQGAAPVRCGCRLGCTEWGEHWRYLANMCAVAMRPHVRLL